MKKNKLNQTNKLRRNERQGSARRNRHLVRKQAQLVAQLLVNSECAKVAKVQCNLHVVVVDGVLQRSRVPPVHAVDIDVLELGQKFDNL